MKDYSKVTYLEYIKKRTEMFQSLGRTYGKCDGVKCSECPLDNRNSGKDCGCSEFEREYPLYAIKAVMEFESVVDWANVPVDTKILVSHYGKDWTKRHFAKYENGKIYCFSDGATSFSTNGFFTLWDYAKLYKER